MAVFLAIEFCDAAHPNIAGWIQVTELWHARIYDSVTGILSMSSSGGINDRILGIILDALISINELKPEVWLMSCGFIDDHLPFTGVFSTPMA